MANSRRSPVSSMIQVGSLKSHHARHPKNRTIYVALLAAVVGATSFSKAATLTWDPGLTPTTPSGGTGTWALTPTANWSNGTTDIAWTDVTAAGVDLAVFGGTAGAVSLNTNLSALGLLFATPNYAISGTGNLTLGASGINAGKLSTGTTSISNNLILGAAQTWNIGSNLSLSGTITGAGHVHQNCPRRHGDVHFGANNYTGGTFMVGGKVIISGAGANAGTSTYTVGNGSTFIVDNTTAAGGNNNARIADASTIGLSGGTFPLWAQRGCRGGQLDGNGRHD